MASHEDSLFDNNKYFFPEGAAKIREQRTQQPGLEVPAQRDEQGTPGLQLVPDEQKFVHQDNSKGLYGDYSAPAFLPAISHTTHATHTANVPAQHDGVLSASQAYPWSQPAAIVYPQHWSQPTAVVEPQIEPPLPDAVDQQYQYSQPIAEQPQQSWQPPAASHGQTQTSQSTTTITQSNYPEQVYWAQPTDTNGNLHPYNPSQHSYTSLEAASRYSDGQASAWTHGTDTRPTLLGGAEVPFMKEHMTPQPSTGSLASWKNPRTRKWWIVGGILGLLIVIGATIGGVLGGRASGESNNHEHGGSNLNSDNATSTTTLTTIRQNSKLAVTGYRGGNGNYSLRLFFQDPGDRLRFMDKSSSVGAWTDPVTLDTLDFEPMPNGSIAAGAYLGHDPQLIELFYLDANSRIRGQVFNFWDDRTPPKGHSSTINDYPLQVAENSSISCYFPYIVSQDKDNDQIRWTFMPGQNMSNDSQPWWVNDTSVNTLGSPRTDLALLPITQTSQNNGGFVYRSDDGKLGLTMKNYSGDAVTGVSWNEGTLSTSIPAESAIGAFVVGRPYTADSVNTYILYQDEQGVIQVVWQDGDDWQGPETYDALGNAEFGTDIECLTQAAWDQDHVQVSREQDMNRCFFQDRGTRRVKEVWFDGTEWKDEGFVPLD
ncbi:hypothetical protein SUNI508_05521 [Seiridium unicorne]|uniref:Fucose-specific lectin n=1 Tax=Seiridium unicorne TaxID=138068 RepID=A0ABR2V411_9PEZI